MKKKTKKNWEKFLLGWNVYILLLGISMIILFVIPNIGQYLISFVTGHPEYSWCPTFLTLYGAAMLLGYKRVGYVAGVILLPLGIIVSISGFMHMSLTDLYPHLIHVSELITGILTVYQIYLWKPKWFTG